jgi:signal transduction histidine kinase
MLPHPQDERTRRAMLLLFYAQSGVSLVAAALLVLLHVGTQIDRVAPPALLAWGVAFAVLIVWRARWKRRVAQLPEAADPAPWERRAELGALLTGGLWALALVMAFDARQGATQMYAAMLACLTCVASINVMAPQPRAFVMLIAPVAVALIALFLSLGSWGGAYNALLVMSAVALAMALTLRHTRLLRESHALRFEREALLAQAQAAREAQTRFLAAASHDLRQPVHALGLLAAQAAYELKGRRAAQTAEQLQTMAQALDGLVESLLDVSRLDSGALQPQWRSLPLQPLFERLSTEYAVLAEAKGLQWRLRPTVLWVRSDAQQLERLLRNLLSNALMHTAQGACCWRRGGARAACRSPSGTLARASRRNTTSASSRSSCSWPTRDATGAAATVWAWPSWRGWPGCWTTRWACAAGWRTAVALRRACPKVKHAC